MDPPPFPLLFFFLSPYNLVKKRLKPFRPSPISPSPYRHNDQTFFFSSLWLAENAKGGSFLFFGRSSSLRAGENSPLPLFSFRILPSWDKLIEEKGGRRCLPLSLSFLLNIN